MGVQMSAAVHPVEHSMVAAAIFYKAQGYRPLPIRTGTKKARIDWKVFQDRQPTDAEIREWYDRWPEDGIGLIVGDYCSTVVVDIDGDIGERAFAALGP